MTSRSLSLEQSILRAKAGFKNPPRRVLMALSGGCDSMVLGRLILKWQRGLRIELGVAHVHHGASGSRSQSVYRDQAREFVKSWCDQNHLPFFTNETAPNRTLSSEQEWRDWRESWFKIWITDGNFDTVATAHHRDDLLETRLLRLIRGTGVQGLRAMREYGGGKWRPLLKTSRTEIRKYASAEKVDWLEDPSNAQTDRLRNWMRREWLPKLEAHQPGASSALARSLENLAVMDPDDVIPPYVGLRREQILSVSTPRQREMVVNYLRSMGLRGYQSSHVDELLKRMRLSCDTQTFAMLGHKFHISREFVWASRV